MLVVRCEFCGLEVQQYDCLFNRYLFVQLIIYGYDIVLNYYMYLATHANAREVSVTPITM